MTFTAIQGGSGRIEQSAEALQLIEDSIAAHEAGCEEALFALGVAFSTGSHGCRCDLVEAHKWFNVAASRGHVEAAHCRADIAEEMTAREIAEAQRHARRWLQDESRKVA